MENVIKTCASPFMQGVGVPGTVINRYCWIMSTFTLPKHFEGEIGEDFIHHGVGEPIIHT